MRILVKLLMKFFVMVAMVLLMGSGLKHGTRFITGGSGGLPGVDGKQVTSEESDLMSTVLSSAMRLLSGKASRSELSEELNSKLYDQRGDTAEMAELGIDLVKSKKPAPIAGADAKQAAPQPDAKSPGKPGPPIAVERGGSVQGKVAPAVAQNGTTVPGKGGEGRPGEPLPAPELVSGKSQSALAELWKRIKPYSVEMGLVPVVFLGMFFVSKVRRRKLEASLIPEFMAVLPESDNETHEMKHPVGSLTDEEFELLVAMIYQRQGYRVSLPAGLGGGRSGNFKLARKSERLLVKCEKMDGEHRVPVERVRELHDAMTDASATGGLYVTSCGFTWDARHFAKTRHVKLISAKTLDALLDAASATPDEDLLGIAPWMPKFMTKVELTTPHCPVCEVEMEREKEGNASVWLCSQRPECGGRRTERHYKKVPRAPSKDTGIETAAVAAPQPAAGSVVPAHYEPILQPTSEPTAPPVAAQQKPMEAQASIPPTVPEPQRPQVAATRPAAPKPTPSPARGAGILPSFSPKPQSPQAAATQPAAPKQTPSPARSAVARRNAGAGSIQGDVPRRRGFIIMDKPPAAPRPTPSPMRSAGSTPSPAPKLRSAQLPVTKPAAPKPTPIPALGEATGGRMGTGGIPPAAPKRRGFRLPENERVLPRPASKPA